MLLEYKNLDENELESVARTLGVDFEKRMLFCVTTLQHRSFVSVMMQDEDGKIANFEF